jgi:hypothetical protein
VLHDPKSAPHQSKAALPWQTNAASLAQLQSHQAQQNRIAEQKAAAAQQTAAQADVTQQYERNFAIELAQMQAEIAAQSSSSTSAAAVAAPSEDQSASSNGTAFSDPMLIVAGVSVPLSEITSDQVDAMTDEEFKRYDQLTQQQQSAKTDHFAWQCG